MKKNLLLSFVLATLSLGLFAQNNISLTINHKLANIDFAMNTVAKNNLDDDFNVTRLEYYISEISIIHDSGTETAINDLWVLVDATKPTIVELGSHDINNVEKIKLHVGVDAAHNHLDPASFQAFHPLSPKFPSMHWGWDPGYRFVAMEGNGGTALNQLFQLHGLGDINYFTTEVEISTMAENNQVNINLDADYTRALENIALNSGVIVHGDYAEAKQCLENFRDFVFSPASLSTSTDDLSDVITFDIFPNPVNNGSTSIVLTTENGDNDYQLSVTDITGRQIQLFNKVKNNDLIDLQNQASGMYFVNLIKDGQSIISKKMILK